MSSIIKVNTYQDANGNALFSSDGSGTVTLNSNFSGVLPDNTPAFRMFMSGNQTLSANTETKIQMNTTSGNSNTGWDSNSAFDTSNYKFTVPSGEGGKYNFKASVLLEYADGLNEYGRMMFYVNGAEKANFRQGMNSSGLQYSLTLSAILNLSAGDYVELYAIHSHTSSRSIDSNSRYTWFEGYKLIGA